MEKQKNRGFNIGLMIVLIILFLVILSIFYTPYPPNQMNGLAKNMAPSANHLFGTDNFGRDIFSRCMEGGRTTFLVAALTVLIGVFFGTIIGALSGYYGGILDEVLMRINDVVLAFPSILLALVLVSVLGSGKYNIIIALGIIFIPSFARITRSEFITIKQMDYVKSAKLMGASDLRIMFVHILPNTLKILLSAIAIGFNNAVLAEAGMSYLGLGVQPPFASLGRMLSEAQTFLFSAPWYAIAPGMMIVITVFGFSLMSDRD